MTIINIRNLSVQYQAEKVLTNISFKVAEGDYIGIVGPNGSGKTTLIKTVLGLLPVTSGQVVFAGSQRIGQYYKNIGYLPQNTGMIDPHFPATVKEIIALGLLANKKMFKRLTREDHSAIDNVLKLLKIEKLKDKPIGKLSGGQQQKVFVARALVNSPEILVLDEPTTALDPQAREMFYNFLKKLNSEGITILLVTHDVGSIGHYATKLLYLDGRMIFYGNFDEFCHSRKMTDYFGEYSQHLICKRHG